MKPIFFLIIQPLIFFLIFSNISFAQPQPTPGVNAEICPGNAGRVSISFNVGNSNPNNYTLIGAVGCTIVSNLIGGTAIVEFSDKREPHKFDIYSTTWNQVVGTYTYTKVQTLDGVKGAFSVPPAYTPPPNFDDYLPSTVVGQCITTPFRYTSPPVYYKDASGVNFGALPMNLYEWIVPKGWKINSTVSDGITPVVSSIFADITPDPLSIGEFKIRALNNCTSANLVPSTWFKVYLNRPSTNLNITSDKTVINCGEQPLTTFTFQGTSGISCVDGYTWNVGAGWLLPNGTPAPSVISTGASNILTLKPDCGKDLGSVSAKVTVLGVSYPASAAVKIPIAQTSVIAGPSYLCSGSATYTISPLPCNSTVIWSQPPSANASLNSLNTSPVTLTYGGTSGYFNLSAKLTACGVEVPLTFPMHAGPFVANDYIMNWNNGTPPYYCLNQTITFTLSGAPVGSNYLWPANSPFGWSKIYDGANVAVYKSPTTTGYPTTGSISVGFNEPCGTNINKYFQVIYLSNLCSSTQSPYSITPNPASTSITIACKSLQTYCNISQVQITDTYGALKSSQSWPYTNQQVQMPVSFLPNGTYIAKIYDGSQWYSNTFIVQR